MALAPSAVSVTRPGVVGTLCLANSSFAWYSKRSMGSLLCVGLFASESKFLVARLRELYRERSEVPSSAPMDVADLTEPREVIQLTFPGGLRPKLATPRARRLTCQGPDNVMVTARGTIHFDPANLGSDSCARRTFGVARAQVFHPPQRSHRHHSVQRIRQTGRFGLQRELRFRQGSAGPSRPGTR